MDLRQVRLWVAVCAILGGSAATSIGCGGSNSSSVGSGDDGGTVSDGPSSHDGMSGGDSGPTKDGAPSDGPAGDSASAEGGGSDGGGTDGGGTDSGGTDGGGSDGGGSDGGGTDSGATDGGGTDAAATYTVGGSVSGLAGSGLVLQDNGGDNLTINGNGSFTFPTPLANGSTYTVTVLTDPSSPTETCTVNSGSGTLNGANVTNITVACSTSSYTVGGTITGLTGTVVLLDNGGDALTVSANGPFTFATPVASGANYDVTVGTQPTGQTCTVSGGTGVVGTGKVTSVVVNCAGNTYTVGGSISGLTGTIVLQDNGGDNLTLTGNGTFAFATPLATASPYAVTIASQPVGETCTVTNGTGVVAGANVTNVTVACTANLYTIGGALTGMAAGGSITLQDNGGNNLTQTSNGTFTFSAPLAYGASYNVSVLTQPTGQACTVSGGTGTVTGNVTSIVVNCASGLYTIGGTVSGLSGTLVLQDNGGNNLTLNANGTFAFSTPLATGQTYDVTINTQPVGETCTVANATGTVATSNVTNVTVTCAPNMYSIGGTLSGLSTGASITLQDNGGNNLALTANGQFTFPQQLAYGSTYNVTILTQPQGETCTVSNGSGTVTANVTNITVTCVPKLYYIGGNMQGLGAGKTIILQDNNTDNLTLTSNGQFVFSTQLPHGATYSVTILTQPVGQTCSITNGTGTVAYANVTNISVICH